MKRYLYLLALIMIVGCKTNEKVVTVTVPEVHEVYHHHTDSIHQIDTVYHEKQTTIMQLDSAAMAEYGIQLKNAERAWLVKTNELERELQRISQQKTDTLHQTDTIAVPYPVEVIKEVPAQLSWWQKTRMHAGEVMMGLLVLLVGYGGLKILRKLPIKPFL